MACLSETPFKQNIKEVLEMEKNKYYEMPDFDKMYVIHVVGRKTIEQQKDEIYSKAAEQQGL